MMTDLHDVICTRSVAILVVCIQQNINLLCWFHNRIKRKLNYIGKSNLKIGARLVFERKRSHSLLHLQTDVNRTISTIRCWKKSTLLRKKL